MSIVSPFRADCRRVGLFGGSFDPIHLGHLIMAQDAMEGAALDQILFIPAAQAPLRSAPYVLPTELRWQLVRESISDNPCFSCSSLEIERGGMSYSYDTAAHFLETYPKIRFFWIVGEDQVARFPAWHRITEMAGKIEFIVLHRRGADSVSSSPVPGLRLFRVQTHAFDISSTEIRQRLADGRSVRYFLPFQIHDLLVSCKIAKNE